MRATVILWIAAMLLLALVAMILPGCYNYRKAVTQHGRSVVTYPAIGADYCSRTYPCRDSLIKGDSVIVYDTLYGAGEVTHDTTTVRDTVRVTKVVFRPVTVTKTVRITDTIRVTDPAALDACTIAKDGAIRLAEDYKAEAAKWRETARTRFWIIAGIGAVGLIGLLLFLKRKTNVVK